MQNEKNELKIIEKISNQKYKECSEIIEYISLKIEMTNNSLIHWNKMTLCIFKCVMRV